MAAVWPAAKSSASLFGQVAKPLSSRTGIFARSDTGPAYDEHASQITAALYPRSAARSARSTVSCTPGIPVYAISSFSGGAYFATHSQRRIFSAALKYGD